MNQEYRITDIGTIPNSWQIVRLNDVVRKKITDGTHKTPKYTVTGVPFVTVSNIVNGNIDFSKCKYITEEEHEILIKRCKPEQNDILLSKVGTLGLTAKVTDPRNFSIFVQVALIKPNDSINSDYLKYVLSSVPIQKQILNKSSQSTMKYIGVGKIGLLHIPLPPLNEQKKIAALLSAVQEAKEKTEAVIESTKALKKSLMKHLFTFGPVPPSETNSIKLRETEIGMIPEEWEVVKLKDYSHLITKGSSPKWQGFEYCHEGIKFIRSQNIGLGKLEVNNIAYLPEAFNIKEKKSIIHNNDVLVNIVGASIGRAAKATQEIEGSNINQAVALVRLNESINPEIIVQFLLSDYGQFQLHSQKKDIARANLSLEDIGNIKAPLMAPNIQDSIINTISGIDNKIQSEINKKQALEELLKSLLHNLMTGKIRVNELQLEAD
ncbi:restriction endonuclease subunit S [candidate division KSB1 bacterium]